MPVRDAETIAQIIRGALGLAHHAIHQLAQRQPAISGVVAVAIRPGREDAVRAVQIATLLRVKTVEVIVVLAAGQQLGERCAAVLGQGEGLQDFQIHRASVLC